MAIFALRDAIEAGKVAGSQDLRRRRATGTGQQFTDEELQAIAETAHSLGRKVTAHAHEAAGIEAEAGGFAEETGSIEPGKAADIVAVADSPLVAISAVLDVRFVMRDGVVFKQD